MKKRKRKTRFRPVANAPSLVMEVLNDPNEEFREDQETREELKWFVDLWLESGPDLQKMGQAMGSTALKRFPSKGKFYLQLTNSGRPLLIPCPETGSTHAQGIFLQFILHPSCEQLAGPCRRCGNYFLKKKRNHQIYCSRKCLAATTAVSATKKSRDEARIETLARINEAIRDWRQSNSRQSWQGFTISQISNKYRQIITTKLLTRWVNQGRLDAPLKE